MFSVWGNVNCQLLGRKLAALWIAAAVLCWPLCSADLLEGIYVSGMVKMYSLAV